MSVQCTLRRAQSCALLPELRDMLPPMQHHRGPPAALGALLRDQRVLRYS